MVKITPSYFTMTCLILELWLWDIKSSQFQLLWMKSVLAVLEQQNNCMLIFRNLGVIVTLRRWSRGLFEFNLE